MIFIQSWRDSRMVVRKNEEKFSAKAPTNINLAIEMELLLLNESFCQV